MLPTLQKSRVTDKSAPVEHHYESPPSRRNSTVWEHSFAFRVRFKLVFQISYGVNLFLFIYLGFYVAFNTVQVISRRVVGKGGGNQYIQLVSGFCTVNCRPTASNYQLSHLRPCRESNPGLRGGRRECYHSATVAPLME